MGGDSMPSGMVSAFNSTNCPAGWKKYELAKGRFVIGLNDGGTLNGNRGGSLPDVAVDSHNHRWGFYQASTKKWGAFNQAGTTLIEIADWIDGVGNEGVGTYPISRNDSSSDVYYYTDNHIHTPPYVQLLYCEKV